MKVLLLNPPGKLAYSRDYFCSKVTKAGYVEQPIDFLCLSGIILSGGHSLKIIDSIAEGLDFTAAAAAVSDFKPDALIFLSGSTSWKDDFDFLLKQKQNNPDLVLIGIGDIFLTRETFIKNEWLDGVILDFTSVEILKYLRGQTEDFQGLAFRKKGRVYFPSQAKASGEFTIPIPRHELFLKKPYSFPFVKSYPFTTILTDYGCPFSCRFCLYPVLGYKVRKLDNVFEELEYIHSLGIRELFVKDQSFGADLSRAIGLCEGMRKIGKFSWACFLRTDLAKLELLQAIKKAGCHTVMLGVESASAGVLKKYKPGIEHENIRGAFSLCRRLGVDTVGIFILGFPGEDRQSCLNTIDLAVKLNCDFASFNLFVPKFATPLRKDLIKEKVITDDSTSVMDQSGIAGVWSDGSFSAGELDALRRLALRRFYLRPGYLSRRILRKFSSWAEFTTLFSSACFILGDLMGKRRK